MNPIAEFVKENRKAAGLTQEVLGFALCVSLSRARKPCVWIR